MGSGGQIQQQQQQFACQASIGQAGGGKQDGSRPTRQQGSLHVHSAPPCNTGAAAAKANVGNNGATSRAPPGWQQPGAQQQQQAQQQAKGSQQQGDGAPIKLERISEGPKLGPSGAVTTTTGKERRAQVGVFKTRKETYF
jgi:hypothetical protein